MPYEGAVKQRRGGFAERSAGVCGLLRNSSPLTRHASRSAPQSLRVAASRGFGEGGLPTNVVHSYAGRNVETAGDWREKPANSKAGASPGGMIDTIQSNSCASTEGVK